MCTYAQTMSCLVNGPVATGNAEEDDNLDDQVSTLYPAADVELVMSQAHVCRCKAIKSLTGNQGDIISAILQLTMQATLYP